MLYRSLTYVWTSKSSLIHLTLFIPQEKVNVRSSDQDLIAFRSLCESAARKRSCYNFQIDTFINNRRCALYF